MGIIQIHYLHVCKEDSENRYYVTPTSFSNTGEIRGFSKTLDWSYTSYPVSMRSNAVNVTVDNPYLGNGPVGQWCCLSTYWGQSSVTNVLRVTGRYNSINCIKSYDVLILI